MESPAGTVTLVPPGVEKPMPGASTRVSMLRS
jgi:hypothetical protein